MNVYHGSSVVVAKPDLSKSKVRIDFGPGFYVTTFKEQAEKWSRRYYKSNDQIVFKTARAVERLLTFVRAYEVEAAHV